MAAINPVIKSFSGCLPLCFYVPINEGLRIAITGLTICCICTRSSHTNSVALQRGHKWKSKLFSHSGNYHTPYLNYGNSRLAGFTIPPRRYFLHKIIAWFQTKKINSGTRFMCGTWPWPDSFFRLSIANLDLQRWDFWSLQTISIEAFEGSLMTLGRVASCILFCLLALSGS